MIGSVSALWFVRANQQIEWKIARLRWRMNTLVWRILILFLTFHCELFALQLSTKWTHFERNLVFHYFHEKKMRCSNSFKKVRLAQRKGKTDSFNMPTKNNTNKHVWSLLIFCSSLPQIALQFVNIWSEVNQEVYMSIISSSPRFFPIFFKP